MSEKSLWETFVQQCSATGNKLREVFMKDVGFPTDGDKSGFHSFVASPAGMPSGLSLYYDGTDLRYRWYPFDTSARPVDAKEPEPTLLAVQTAHSAGADILYTWTPGVAVKILSIAYQASKAPTSGTIRTYEPNAAATGVYHHELGTAGGVTAYRWPLQMSGDNETAPVGPAYVSAGGNVQIGVQGNQVGGDTLDTQILYQVVNSHA